jgi:hypothetical protein
MAKLVRRLRKLAMVPSTFTLSLGLGLTEANEEAAERIRNLVVGWPSGRMTADSRLSCSAAWRF